MRFLSNYRENWTKLMIASFLLCLVFSIGALAQANSNKPLDDDAVSTLVDELKDGLSNLIEDPQVTAITKKWDARKDLAGKTKAAILKLLFADVKSIVKDKETQDNVWSLWTKSGGQNAVTEPKPTPAPKPTPVPKPASGPAETAYFIIVSVGTDYPLIVKDGDIKRWPDDDANSNSRWEFKPAGDGYYYIINTKFKLAVVAGDVFDGSIYLQDPKGRDNAKWKLIPLGFNKFRIIDKKHGKLLAYDAGHAEYAGEVQHADRVGIPYEIWEIVLLGGNKDIPKEIEIDKIDQE